MTADRPSTVVLAVDASDVPALCERVRVLLDGSGADLVVCDLGGVGAADVATVDALARLQLAARRVGRRIRVRHASAELQELLALTGLGNVLGVEPGR